MHTNTDPSAHYKHDVRLAWGTYWPAGKDPRGAALAVRVAENDSKFAVICLFRSLLPYAVQATP